MQFCFLPIPVACRGYILLFFLVISIPISGHRELIIVSLLSAGPVANSNRNTIDSITRVYSRALRLHANSTEWATLERPATALCLVSTNSHPRYNVRTALRSSRLQHNYQ